MKKFFLIAVAACVALASCTKNEVAPSDPQEITYQAVVGKSTKALIDGTTYATTAPSFGTYAYYTPAEESFPGVAQEYIPESEVSYVDSRWKTATPYYWPKNGSLTFFSFSPFAGVSTKASCTPADGITITEWEVNGHQDVDLMVADVQTEKTANGSNGGYEGVPTIFRHKLSQIVDIVFKTDKDYNASAPFKNGDKQFFINYVKFNKLEETGTYVSGNNVDGTNLGAWTLPSPATYDGVYTWFEENSPCDTEFKNAGTSANDMTHLLMMPQLFVDAADAKTVSNIEVKYTIRTHTSASNHSDDVVTTYISLADIFSTNSGKLDVNKKVTITITAGVNQIYWAPSVVAWDETGTGSATI